MTVGYVYSSHQVPWRRLWWPSQSRVPMCDPHRSIMRPLRVSLLSVTHVARPSLILWHEGRNDRRASKPNTPHPLNHLPDDQSRTVKTLPVGQAQNESSKCRTRWIFFLLFAAHVIFPTISLRASRKVSTTLWAGSRPRTTQDCMGLTKRRDGVDNPTQKC